MALNLLDSRLQKLFVALSRALIKYTPEYFKEIHCEITHKREKDVLSIFYKISCPQFPNEGTTVPDANINQLSGTLIEFWESQGETFPGLRFVLKEMPDGEWKSSTEPMNIPNSC